MSMFGVEYDIVSAAFATEDTEQLFSLSKVRVIFVAMFGPYSGGELPNQHGCQPLLRQKTHSNYSHHQKSGSSLLLCLGHIQA